MQTPKNIKNLQDVSRDLTTTYTGNGTFSVQSQSEPDKHYTVTVSFDDDGRTVKTGCTCRWANFNGIACAHVLATLEYLAAQKERTLSFWTSESDARRQKHRLFKLIGNQGDAKAQDNVWITSRDA